MIFEVIEKFNREQLHYQTDFLYDEHEYEQKVKQICEKMRLNSAKDIEWSIEDNELLNKHIMSKL